MSYVHLFIGTAEHGDRVGGPFVFLEEPTKEEIIGVMERDVPDGSYEGTGWCLTRVKVESKRSRVPWLQNILNWRKT
jgi:hypothetical protein